jgi:hypothetical protein
MRSERRQSVRSEDPELRGRRSEPRAVIGLRTTTEMLSGRCEATLMNLSAAGAQLSGDALPALGKDVLVTCGPIEVFGTVVWVESKRCGIQFDEAITPKMVAELRRIAAEADHSSLHQDEIRAAEDWLNGLAR